MSTDRPMSKPARFWASAGVFVGLGLVLGLAPSGALRLQPDSLAQTCSPPMLIFGRQRMK